MSFRGTQRWRPEIEEKKTSGVHFCQKRGLFSLLNFRKFRQMFLLILTLFRMLKITGRVILKTRNSSATTILLMSRTMKIRKLKLFYCQKNARHRAKELWRDIFLGNLSLKEGKNSVGLPVLILEFWWRHVQTKNRPTIYVETFFQSSQHIKTQAYNSFVRPHVQYASANPDHIAGRRVLSLLCHPCSLFPLYNPSVEQATYVNCCFPKECFTN